ncbi:hypothetical protein F383_35611 [Gossypium arboreum]|uniref:Uncharacterized protein n=1 Tax=Gossypium arboreum TaxID=29729 RepID=A0A0B0N6G8_GOSAR|nr:hypothetical protein F383_35611 [Gossypium arboreum]
MPLCLSHCETGHTY